MTYFHLSVLSFKHIQEDIVALKEKKAVKENEAWR